MDLGFLERLKLASPSLHDQPSPRAVPDALLARTLDERGDLPPIHVLEDFGAARVARVGVDEEERFDFGDPGDDAADGDEGAQVGTADLADREGWGVAERAEEEVAIEGERQRARTREEQ